MARPKGIPMSEEWKSKQRVWMLGRPVSGETRMKMSKSQKGKMRSKETIEKLRQAKLKNPVKYWLGKTRPRFSKEWLENMSKAQDGANNARYGKHPSVETCKKISAAHKGLKHTLKTKVKMSEARRGEKNNLWKGGITPINHTIRNSFEMKEWRRHVFTRDDYTCQDCGERGGILNADHELPFALFPDLRFEILNGRTLCVPCHQKIPTHNKVWSLPHNELQVI